MKRLLILILFALGLFTVVDESSAAQTNVLTLTVTDTGDDADVLPGDDKCETTQRTCTLRAAIEEGNEYMGRTIVTFQTGNQGSFVIMPQSALPTITSPITIDGLTNTACTSALIKPPKLFVVLDGSATGTGDGLVLGPGSTGSEIAGLVIGNFNNGIIIESDDATIHCNHIGVDQVGSGAFGNDSNGIYITASSDGHLIGGSENTRNVISGNGGCCNNGGIELNSGSGDIEISHNLLGLNAAGTAAIPNYQGIYANQGSAANVTIADNHISGNTDYGIFIQSGSPTIEGNHIGINVDDEAVPNNYGIYVSHRAGIPLIDDNVVTGNTVYGIEVVASRPTIQDNFIGTLRDGNTVVGSQQFGIYVRALALDCTGSDNESARPIIGGEGPGVANSISGNSLWQVYYQSAQLRCATSTTLRLYLAAAGGTLENNRIGVNLSGTQALGSGGGVYVSTSAVGSANPTILVEDEPLTIRGNAIASGSSERSSLEVHCDLDKFCNPDGEFYTTAIHHSDVIIEENRIGANSLTTVVARNQPAVRLVQAGSLTLRDNTIAARNADSNLLIDDLAYVIGTGGSALNVIENNQIGISLDDSAELNSATDGIVLNSFSYSNTITANAISANGGSGVHLMGGSNLVSNNFIGTNRTTDLDAGGLIGVHLDGANDNQLSGNVIGFHETGVLIESAENNDLWGNSIGTDASGTLNLGNSGNGVRIATGSQNNAVGNDASRPYNRIQFNGGHGIQIWDETGSLSGGTSMHATLFDQNGGLAIELAAEGVTANDNDDIDTGQNGLQNYPVLTTLNADGSIGGTLNSEPLDQYRIDLYQSFTCDDSGHGEGGQWYGSGIIGTASNGNGLFTITRDPSLTGTQLPYITALATHLPTGNTSEFSACIYNPDALRFVVDDAGDGANATTDGACDIGGVCTLREAIQEVNASDYPHTIVFDIPVSNAVISPQSPLPEITNQVVIDGFSQGSSNGCSINSSVTPTPGITLDGGDAVASGLKFEAGSNGSIVRGLSLVHFIEALRINSPVAQLELYCNLIGLQADGSTAGGNVRAGILLLGDDNTIASNVIGHNLAGVAATFADRNLFLGNAIGTDFAGSADFGNTGSGISLDGDNNVLGNGANDRPNLIKNNGVAGVIGSKSTSIYFNAFGNNGDLAIDLGTFGVQPNDPNETDGIQNYPVITGQDSCNIEGTLTSTPETTFRIDMYYTTACDQPSGHGEGSHYFGFVKATTNHRGEASFAVPSLDNTTGYPYFVATATNLTTGNSSEFSACYEYVDGVPTQVGFAAQTAANDNRSASGVVVITVLMLLVVVTIWGLWRRRYLVLILVGLCAIAIGVEQPEPVLAETVNSCTVIGDILTDGGVVEGDGGVLLGATPGTLSAEMPVDVSSVTPTTLLTEDASVTRISGYFGVSSAETVIANTDGLFILGIPVPAGANTAQLAVAILQNNSTIADGGTTGESWTVSPVAYDAATNIASLSLTQLSDSSITVTLIEGPSFNPIPPPSRSSQSVSSVSFELQCGLYTFTPLCTQSALAAYSNEFAFAYADFVTTYGFNEPALKNEYTRFVPSGDSYLPEYDPITTFYGVYLLDDAICAAQTSSFAGRYNPTTKALEVCIGSPSVTANGIKIVRHELFHAIQFAYPKMAQHHHTENAWVFEGTATAVMESTAPLQRTSYFTPYHKLYDPLGETDDLSVYYSQEFWVYHNQGNLGYLGIQNLFDQYGPRLEDVDSAMMDLDTRYWEWAKNNAFERSYDYGGGLAGPCQPTINNPNVIGTYNDHIFDPDATPTFRESWSVAPRTARMWRITIANDADQLIFGVIPDDPSEEMFQKFYRALDSNCVNAAETSDASFDNVQAGEVFYVLVAKAPHAGVPDAVVHDLQIITNFPEE